MFLLVSIPARWLRFAASVVIAQAAARWLAPWSRRRAEVELLVLAVFWATFYSFYFSRF